MLRLWFLICLTLLPGLSFAQNETPNDNLVDMNFSREISVSALAEWVSRRTGKNILADQSANASVRIICPKLVNKDLAYEIFLAAIEQVGFSAVTTGPVTKIMKSKQAKGSNSAVYYGNDYKANQNEIITLVLPLVHLNANQIRLDLMKFNSSASIISHPASNSLIITDNGYDVQKILKIIRVLDVKTQQSEFKIAHLRYRDAKEVINLLTQVLKKEPGSLQYQDIEKAIYDQRTNSIFIYGNKKFVEHAMWFIRKIDALEHDHQNTNTVRIMPIYFSRAEKIAATLKAIPNLSKYEKRTIPIDFDADTNSLLIAADPLDYKHIASLVHKLDVKRTQVLIESIFLEVKAGNNFTYGTSALGGVASGKNKTIIGWEAGSVAPIAMQPSAAGTPSDQQIKAISSSFKDLSVGVFAKEIELGNGIKVTPGALINMLRVDDFSRTLSKPVIFGSENEEASISIGQTILYSSSETNNAGLTDTTTQKEKIDLTMTVKPKVNSSTTVSLDLDLSFNLLGGFQNGLPEIASRQTKQTVVLSNGQTAVLSGLRSHASYKEQKKVPILGDIPILGALFSSRENRTIESYVLIFLTPHIVLNPKDLDAVFEKKLTELNAFSLQFLHEDLKADPILSDNKRINRSFKYSEDL